jgi:anhydro-N-acetylmuramic acid kinase
LNRIERLRRVIEKPNHRVIGLMSGTSVDAIDVALAEIEGHGADAQVKLLEFRSYPFPRSVRARLFRTFNPEQARVDQICNLDFLMGELFAEAALCLLRDCGINPESIDLIGSAGQTIWHEPRPVREDVAVDWIDHPIETRSTLAIGQSAVIAERTGVITIGDLRVRDVAAGGHGAPLISYADWVLLRHPTRGRCIQNIGGIGNVTYVPPNATLDQVIGFDTGPGNMVIDALAEVATAGQLNYDRDGELATRGTVREALLRGWMEDPYFRRPPPKTTGREHFGVQFARRVLTQSQDVPIHDLIATATALTAHSIAAAYRDFIRPRGPIHDVILGGGGAFNPFLVGMLTKLLPDVQLLRHEDVGIDSQAKEALAIAIIAHDSIIGSNNNVPGATGGRPTVLGKISL